MSRTPRRRSAQARPGPRSRSGAWKLSEAKAQFNELVSLARSAGPQRVTVRGQDAVVVVSAEKFAALMPSARQPNLYVLLSTSPLRHVDLEREGRPMPVRDVPL